ncbi:MAG: EamA family transporter RarD [Deltaproteobacteria bacterium]|jgi:chloramphenicol-sensitive protein RarD|nr:EamA family transporter RarD [Deltaproteobacteria bacterium]
MRAFSLRFPVKNLDPGFWAAIASSFIWGALPLYWNILKDLSPYLILCHRIVWSFVFLLPLVVFTRRLGEVRKALKDARLLRTLFCSSLILGVNWLVFIWAVNNGMVLETSFGAFITPLLVFSFGVVVFHDGVSRLQLLSVLIAAFGVTFEVIFKGTLPWVALSLAGLFGTYGFLRKLEPVESLPGLLLETLILFPFALAFIVWSDCNTETAAWGADFSETLILMGTGVITSVPLILYGYGARHIPFSTLGILQYISPSCTFLIGLLVFQEDVGFARAVAFAVIWAALALYTFDSLRHRRVRKTEIVVKPGRTKGD